MLAVEKLVVMVFRRNLDFFGVQVNFDNNFSSIMAAHPTTTLSTTNTLQRFNHADRQHQRSSLSHSFNRGRQKLPQTACRCLLRAHNFSIGKPST